VDSRQDRRRAQDVDCNIWIGSVGVDGFGRYSITRVGMGLCVRPNRYGLQLATSRIVLALRECGNPVSVEVTGQDRRACLRWQVHNSTILPRTALSRGGGRVGEFGGCEAILDGAARVQSGVWMPVQSPSYLVPNRACSEKLSVSRSSRYAASQRRRHGQIRRLGSRVETVEPAAMAARQSQREESTPSARHHVLRRSHWPSHSGARRNPLPVLGLIVFRHGVRS
jgi:hypothetical protein